MGGEGRMTGGLRHPGKAKARDVYGGEPLAPSVACEGLYTAVTSGLQINRPPARKCTHDAHPPSRHVTNAAFDVFASLSTGLTQRGVEFGTRRTLFQIPLAGWQGGVGGGESVPGRSANKELTIIMKLLERKPVKSKLWGE
ncbi:hypothetical protein C0Q70_04965 [Pomacea canaliculata]|uniref:Uncharacterized protein n=1 Tax=Pomacea canaliculata TaxID=400727 RepID=A0A2T7PJU4_POMCA|nr:hypothetical protein C0Q70_04965 [Pomacea canaliculata]